MLASTHSSVHGFAPRVASSSPSATARAFLRSNSNKGYSQRTPSALRYRDDEVVSSLTDSLPFTVEDATGVPLLQNKAKIPSLEDLRITFGLPVLVEPTSDDQKSLSYLQMFLKDKKDWVDMMIQRHGAIMFRGFGLNDAKQVEDAILAYNRDLNNDYRGTSPRNVQEGTAYVFSAAEVPLYYPIAQHLEMSFLPSPPKQLYFSAINAPTTIGGETALADFRKVYCDIPKSLRKKLQQKKLHYTRTHNKAGERNTHDVAAMQSWPELFGTTSKDEVEDIAQAEGMPMRWAGKNNDIFVSEFNSDPFRKHPETGERVWFNHAQVFHWTTISAELLHAFRRTKDWRYFGHALRVGVASVWKHGILRQKMALHVSFGDGTPISVWEMHLIRKAVHKNMSYKRWQQGDLLMIDNFSTSHGRQPTYDKGRNIVVAWSDPVDKTNEVDSIETEAH